MSEFESKYSVDEKDSMNLKKDTLLSLSVMSEKDSKDSVIPPPTPPANGGDKIIESPTNGGDKIIESPAKEEMSVESFAKGEASVESFAKGNMSVDSIANGASVESYAKNGKGVYSQTKKDKGVDLSAIESYAAITYADSKENTQNIESNLDSKDSIDKVDASRVALSMTSEKDSMDKADTSLSLGMMDKTDSNITESKTNGRTKSIIKGANDLSLGISMVVAVLLGLGLGYLLYMWLRLYWLIWLGLGYGFAAAFLNVFKAYKRLKKELDSIKDDEKYKYMSEKK